MILKSAYEKLEHTAHHLLRYAGNHKIWLIEGPMGSGKTSLIQAVCRILQTVHPVHSPTFSIINQYQTIDDNVVYHFDCYRLSSIQDAILLDFESYFASGCYCFIEWPSKISAILPTHYFLITIEIANSTTRYLNCRAEPLVASL